MHLLRQSTHRMIIKYHEKIGHIYVPNINARIPSPDGAYFVKTNSQGFRSNFDFDRKVFRTNIDKYVKIYKDIKIYTKYVKCRQICIRHDKNK